MNFNPATSTGFTRSSRGPTSTPSRRACCSTTPDAPCRSSTSAPKARRAGLQRLAFRAAVPGFGYRLYRFAKRARRASGAERQFRAAGQTGRTHHSKPPDGGSTLKPARGRSQTSSTRRAAPPVFSGPAHRGIVIDDPTDTWSHGIDRFGFEGEGTRAGGDQPARRRSSAARARDHHQRRREPLRDHRRAARRRATCLSICASTIDWREQQKLFRIAYPLAGARVRI